MRGRTQSLRRHRDALLLLLLLLFLWELSVRLFHVKEYLLPAPSRIVQALFSSGDWIGVHTWATLQEVIFGFLLALAAGVVLALAMNLSTTLERALYPLLVASQTVPVIAVAPILLVWAGYGLWPKILVAAWIAFFPIVVNTFDGLRAADPEMLQLLRMMGANRWQVFLKGQFPASLPLFFSGLKIAVTAAVAGAVIGEWLGADAGLGYFVRRMSSQYQSAPMFAAVAVLALMGIVLFSLFSWLERWATPWRRCEEEDDRRMEKGG